jgi:CubicO group peptidase (beta-lactamase class C family)
MIDLRMTSSLRASTLAILSLLACAACGGQVGGGVSGPIQVTTPNAPSAELQTVITYITGQMASCHVPGGAIAIVKNGKVTDQAGFGVSDPATGAQATPHTLFLMGAAGTPVLGALALKLAEEGAVDLDHPVTDYVPLQLGGGADPTAISVNQLLLATSGFPERLPGQSCGPAAPDAWFLANASQPLWAPTAAVWNFSHIGYGVAAWALADAASESFTDLAASRVFGPAGMTTATYDPAVAAAGDLAVGANIDPSTGDATPETASYPTTCALLTPVDGLYASVLDYASFAGTVLAGGGSMLSPASNATFEAGQTVDYIDPSNRFSYGLYQEEPFEGVTTLHQGGTANGFATEIWIIPASDLAIVLAFNGYNSTDTCSAFDAARFAALTYLGLGKSAETNWKTAPSTWSPFVGTYVDPVNLGTLEVALAGDALTVRSASYGTVTLSPKSATSFDATFSTQPQVTVTFQPDATGPGGWLVTPYGVGKRQR